MAVLGGGSAGARLAWNQGDDNVADRLLGLEAQVGRVETWVPSSGAVADSKISNEIAQLDVGLNLFEDGVTNGTNTLTSVSAPFEASMVGLPITIFGQGRRVVASFVSATEITVNGAPIAAAVGLTFTTPIGITQFTDGETYGDQRLTSAAAPFNATHVGTRTSISGIGSRVITTYTSPTEVEVDGVAIPANQGRFFTLLTDSEPREESLTSGGQVVDSHRIPALTSPAIMRWEVGGRRKRGKPREIWV
jgi:hypothetical protein